MSKRTNTKILRTMDWTQKRGMFKKEHPDPAEARGKAGDCHVCGLPVYVSKGQIINIGTQTKTATGEKRTVYAHKRCRKLKKTW